MTPAEQELRDLVPWWRTQLDADKARATADLDADRRILAVYEHALSNYGYVRFGEWESCSDECAEVVLAEVVKLRLLPYADRPGYRPEWSPDPEGRAA